jgi:dTMP kinase
MTKGKMIVFEGLEGAGKSTMITFLQQYLASNGIDTILIREPGGTHLGEKLRDIVKYDHLHEKAALLLFYASRLSLLNEVILPALSQGKWVIADRFEWSTYAYQGFGSGIPTNDIDAISLFALSGFKPDVYIYLSISPEIGFQRIAKRGELDIIENQPLSFFENVKKGYDYLYSQSEFNNSAIMLDASRSVKEVQTAIMRYIVDRFLGA